MKIFSWDLLGSQNGYGNNNITAVNIANVREVIESEKPDICILYSYWLAYADKLELEKLGYECTSQSRLSRKGLQKSSVSSS